MCMCAYWKIDLGRNSLEHNNYNKSELNDALQTLTWFPIRINTDIWLSNCVLIETYLIPIFKCFCQIICKQNDDVSMQRGQMKSNKKKENY